ncbi:hypothetical protein K443DRAFT_684435 [Laccaria amethystina LaAM-08-1]|uniref:Uncharacterized protein n=1 Tax=Laccaria amethystina LaAM-08-1 TaxID=1095629 RepID=A0A0C9XBH7_9AGAR|nr:hypothetical protein K443DRAFT_684435 [Laccaria amethystina LaAM-08-1]
MCTLGCTVLELRGAFAHLEFGCPGSSIHNDNLFATRSQPQNRSPSKDAVLRPGADVST